MKTSLIIIFILFTACDSKNEYVDITIPDAGKDIHDSDMENNDADNDVGQFDDILENYNNNHPEYPYVTSVFPSGVMRDATQVIVNFSEPMADACYNNFQIAYVDEYDFFVPQGYLEWGENYTKLIWTAYEPFPQGTTVWVTIDEFYCHARVNEFNTIEWLEEPLTHHFELDEIVCDKWSPLLDSELDASMLTEDGEVFITTGADFLWVGAFSNNEETKGFVSLDFYEIYYTFNPQSIEGIFFTLYESEGFGTYPNFLELDILSFTSPLDATCYSAPSLFSPLPPSDSELNPVDDNYSHIFWDVTPEIITLLENDEPGVTFRIRGTDLTYDGNSNFRVLYTSESTTQNPLYGPTLRFCYWNHELYTK